MERGVAKVFDRFDVVLVVAGTPTRQRVTEAFKQGLSDEPGERRYRLAGARCSRCGFVELYSDGDPLE